MCRILGSPLDCSPFPSWDGPMILPISRPFILHRCDILFFWVARRMVMMGLELTDVLPLHSMTNEPNMDTLEKKMATDRYQEDVPDDFKQANVEKLD
jgi:hypothetical protein